MYRKMSILLVGTLFSSGFSSPDDQVQCLGCLVVALLCLLMLMVIVVVAVLLARNRNPPSPEKVRLAQERREHFLKTKAKEDRKREEARRQWEIEEKQRAERREVERKQREEQERIDNRLRTQVMLVEYGFDKVDEMSDEQLKEAASLVRQKQFADALDDVETYLSEPENRRQVAKFLHFLAPERMAAITARWEAADKAVATSAGQDRDRQFQDEISSLQQEAAVEAERTKVLKHRKIKSEVQQELDRLPFNDRIERKKLEFQEKLQERRLNALSAGQQAKKKRDSEPDPLDAFERDFADLEEKKSRLDRMVSEGKLRKKQADTYYENELDRLLGRLYASADERY